MNVNEIIVAALHQAMRGEPIDVDSFGPARAAAIAQDDLHGLGCAMLKALIEHYQTDLQAQRAILLSQRGSSGA